VRSGRVQADSRARPLRRRAPMMDRPARVRMRNRKPWVLARRRLFGWKVRFTSGLQRVDRGSHQSGTDDRPGTRTRVPSKPSPDRSTVRGSVGQGQTGRTNRRRIQPARVRTRYPRIPAADRRRRHAENTGESCGQRLMPRAGVVSVAGSTRATTTRSRPRTVSCFRRSGRSCPGRTGDRPDAPHTVDDRVDVSRGAVRPAPFGHRRCRSKDKRETA
jgi:hypothetical protein